MKKIVFALFLFLAPFVAAFGAAAPQGLALFQGSSAVVIPPELVAAINAAGLFLVLAGLQLVFELIGIDLRGFAAAIAAIVVEFAIAQLQSLIDLVPAQFDPLVQVGLLILLAILAAFGFFQVAFRRKRLAQLFSRE